MATQSQTVGGSYNVAKRKKGKRTGRRRKSKAASKVSGPNAASKVQAAKSDSPAPEAAAKRRGVVRRLLGVPTIPFRAVKAHPGYAVLSVSSALMVVLSFPRYDIQFFTFINLVPLLFVVTKVRPQAAFGWGWLTGTLLTGLGFYFMVELFLVFGGLPLLAAIPLHLVFSMYQGLNIAIFAALTSYLVRDRHVSVVLVVPLTLVVSEFAARAFFIFPWYMGNATFHLLPFIQSADLFGGFGLSALVGLTGAILFEVCRYILARRAEKSPRFPARAVAISIALLSANMVYGTIRIGQVEAIMAESDHMRIGLVEANIGIYQKAERQSVLDNLLIHQGFSAELEAQGVDLIVWPETSANPSRYALSTAQTRDPATLLDTLRLYPRVPRDVTWFRPSDASLVRHMQDDQRRGTPHADRSAIQRGFRTALLFGVLTGREPTDEEREILPPHPRRAEGDDQVVYNSAMLIDADGFVLGSTDKNVLLVFGEHVPFSSWLYRTFGFNFFEMLPSTNNITPGDGVNTLELPLTLDDGTERRVRIGAMICYEDIIASFGLRLAEMAPNLFINVINDGWFLESSAPYHHLAFSVLRSVEHRIELVRSTNTGVSSFVDPVGRITSQTRLTDAELLIEDVPIMPSPTTLYSRIGDAFAWLCTLLVFGLIIWVRARRNRDAVLNDVSPTGVRG